MEKFKLSRYVTHVPLNDGRYVIFHTMRQTRVFVSEGFFQVLHLFSSGPISSQEASKRTDMDEATVSKMMQYFSKESWIVPEKDDEIIFWKKRFESELGSIGNRVLFKEGASDYQIPSVLELSDFQGTAAFEQLTPLNVLILGGCMAQFSVQPLIREGIRHGFNVNCVAGWPDQLELIEKVRPNMVVYQLSTVHLIKPLWDDAPFITALERRDRLDWLKDKVSMELQNVMGCCGGKLLLVHGFSAPMISPLGILEHREEVNFNDIIFELNQLIGKTLRNHPNTMLLDEERIVSNRGKRWMFDDMLSQYSHHAPIDAPMGISPPGPDRKKTFGITDPFEVSTLLSREYIEHYLIWKGDRAIKCVVMDLDQTLWPGVVGENGFNLEGDDFFQTLKYGVYGGIHQALQILKSHGVLLATCSKNTEEVVFSEWARLETFANDNGLSNVLSREDFVLHKINWDRKSKNMEELMQALELGEGSVLFIDDNPVERAEIKGSFPAMHVMGEDFNRIRTFLLSSPLLQKNTVTQESRERSGMVKAQLKREAVRKTVLSEEDFLRGLDINIRVTKVKTDKRLARISELISRTNQFNTTLLRLNVDELLTYANNPNAGLYTMDVSDRFGKYGLVGVCIVDKGEVVQVVMSCRVLGLKVSVPFVCFVLQQCGVGPYAATIVEGPRNQPCQSLFKEAGFKESNPGEWHLSSLSDLTKIPTDIFHCTLGEG